ncbi:glycosyltransferase family 10 domain-containing protein [Porphyromonas sp. COT-239 OH1446]|uniref:glycosyltransferase family 10 domain-containing protein n=1 Tax=Porphyromonas sp. COT-239 OH1446 TaxID=1515613 RepID=UPI00069004F6|nr:glycosyltransferase family 10 [Porphyromonas sp. COT-239 OH1446]
MNAVERVRNILNYCINEVQMYRQCPNSKYYNFWPCDYNNNWFNHFVEHRGLAKERHRLNFFSVFGNPLLPRIIPGKKVFFTGENLADNSIHSIGRAFKKTFPVYDLVLGFDYEVEDSRVNYMRFPLWIAFLIDPTADYQKIKETIERINDPSTRLNASRDRFACLVASHDKTGIRQKLYDVLMPIASVTCPGRFQNNTNELHDLYANDKREYLKLFKFNVCPENSSTPGYITEKLFDSFASGCIPIYFGGGTEEIEPDIVNQGAFIRYWDDGRMDWMDTVRELWESPSAYRAVAEIPPFKEQAADVIYAYMENLHDKLAAIVR